MPRGTRGAVWFVTRRLRPRPAPQTLAPLAPARSDAQIVSCSERPSGAKGAPAVPSADGTEQIEADRAVILVQPFKLPAKVRPAPSIQDRATSYCCAPRTLNALRGCTARAAAVREVKSSLEAAPGANCA